MISEVDWQRKQEIRRRIMQERRRLKKPWVDDTSIEIVENLKRLPQFQSAKTIHTYVAWRNEVNNHQLIKDILAESRRVVVPAVDLCHHTLLHSLISNFDDLRPGTFGILEPPADRIHSIDISEIDLILVPGLAFDRSGNRLGYGGGYYDEFFKQSDALKIALCFDFQIVEKIPTRAEDERVDILVTENGVDEIGK